MQIKHKLLLLLLVLISPFKLLAETIKDSVYASYDGYTDNVGVDIYSPLIGIKTALSKHFAIDINIRADAISAASISNGNGQYKDGVIVDAVSGASGILGFNDLRIAPIVTLLYEKDSTIVSAGAYYSKELDFDSASGFFSLSQGFNNVNTVVSLGASYATEAWSSTTNRVLYPNNTKTAYDVNANLTQLLTPSAYLQFLFNYNSATGFLSSPYRYLQTDSFAQFDRYPDARSSSAGAIQYVQGLGDSWSTHINYRYYADSWDIDSHTTDLKLFYEAKENILLGVRGRYYYQSKAGFTKKIDDQRIDDTYIVSDYRLSQMASTTTGVSMHYVPEYGDENVKLSFSYDYYFTDKNNFIEAWYGTPQIKASYYSFAIEYDF